MEDTFLRKFGLLIAFGIAGAIAVSLLYDNVAPAASIDLKLSRDEVMQEARAYLTKLNYDLKDYQQDPNFTFDGSYQIFLQSRYGMKRTNELLRSDSLPSHTWNIFWYDRSSPTSQFVETYRVWISPAGKVNGYDHYIADSVERKSLTKEEAQQRAEQFLADQGIGLSEYSLKTSTATQRAKRLDHRFEWSLKDTLFPGKLWVQMLGNEVGGFRVQRAQTDEFNKQMSALGTRATFIGTASAAATFLLFFFIVILFLKKYHEGEVGTKTALLVFIGVYATYILQTSNMFATVGSGVGMGDLNRYNTRLVMFGFSALVFFVFSSVMTFASWSVGESSSRSTWPGKMAAVDGALYRKYFTLDIAEGVVRGYAWGFIMLGGWAMLLFLLSRFANLAVFTRDAGGVGEAYFPSLRPILGSITGAAFSEIVFRLFFISYLKEKLKRTWLAVLISVVVWTLACFFVWDLPFGNPAFGGPMLYPTFATYALFGFIFSFLFLRYDLLTAIVANFILSTLPEAIPLFTSSSPAIHTSMWTFLGLLFVPLVIAAIGFARRERFEFTNETVPAHILRISERERMSKELEIARRVQMSLLPKSSPSATGYDIAGTCIPALEVGGDYYDFVNLGGKKIGIAIGDVSGKGVPAAIYMTLTKGILQSHAEDNVSPKVVLSKVNSLMYRTIDRNSFVSMFYAILDLQAKRIRFARAGQCPVIIAQRQNEKGYFLTPKGMALGLEVGTVFDSVLEEQELDLNSGEVLVFYTDGFTEAMNEHNDEFGEQRLVESIDRNREKSANEIINAICKDVASFTRGWQQHDDMTMVVVKVG